MPQVAAPSARTRVRRSPARGAYDRATVDAVLDEAYVASVAVVDDGWPVVVPMAHVRDGDRLLLHGSTASRLVRRLAAGEPACATVTLLDGLVLARSAFHHSMNYRSVVVLGRGIALEGDALRAALDRFTERVAEGRSAFVRSPSERELAQTAVVALPLDEASAKVRTGGPNDDPEDLALDVWAGVVPLQLRRGRPQRHTAAPSGAGGAT